MKNLYCLSTLLLLMAFGLSQAFAQSIHLKSGDIPQSEMLTPAQVSPAQLTNQLHSGAYYLYLQFDKIPSETEKAKLNRWGVSLLEYQPDLAYMARVSAGINLGKLADAGVKRIALIQPQHKLSRGLAVQDYPAHAMEGQNILVSVVPYETITLNELTVTLISRGFKVLPELQGLRSLVVKININDIYLLAGQAPVMFLSTVEPNGEPESYRGRSLHRANTLSQNPGIGFDGTGVSIAITDDGSINHIDFQGRWTDFTAMDQGGTHGDMTSGIACGAGNLDPTIAGMATGTHLNLYDWSRNLYPPVDNAIQFLSTTGTVITSTSYSQGCGGIYETTAKFLDSTVYAQNMLLHVFSAGNSATNTCSSVYGSIAAPDGSRYGNITGGRKASKNCITTANVDFKDIRDLSSSRGPCEDGRLKPDISAHGREQLSTGPNNTTQTGGGTSAAAPGIAGVSAMLYQAYKEWNNGQNPPSSLIKGILLNTADDLGRPQQDYDFGWGRINARRAIEVLKNRQYLTNGVNQGDSLSHEINVPAGIKELKVMVYWLDRAGAITAAKALVSDLDMQVETPGGATILPWTLSTAANIDSIQRNAIRGIDRVNNMEQVTIVDPAAGNYSVKVLGTTLPMGGQSYHVIYSYTIDDIVLTYPQGGEHFVPGEEEVLRWDAYGDAGTFTIEYSTDNGNNWTNLTTVSGDRRFLEWNIPSITTGEALVRISRNGLTGQSAAAFNIMDLPTNLQVSPDGLNSAEVSWNPVLDADVYDVYLLGEKYMEIVGTTNSQTFQLTGVSQGNTYWVSVRARSGNTVIGRRANAVPYNHTFGNACSNCDLYISAFPYIQSFENGADDWCQFTSDDFDWSNRGGGTPSTNTGPSSASDGNFYMYTETSNPNNPSMRAIIGSPCFNLFGLDSATFSFDYHMFGPNMGTLTLEISDDDGQNWSNLWTRFGAQGNQWMSETVDLSAYLGKIVSFRFNGLGGNGPRSDMAIDNIVLDAFGRCTDFSANGGVIDADCYDAPTGQVSVLGIGGTQPYTYSWWHNGSTSTTAFKVKAGIYGITVTDSFGCSTPLIFTVTEPPAFSFNFVVQSAWNPTAPDGEVTLSLSGGMPPFSNILWSTGDTTLTVTGLTPGVYTVSATDARGCTQTDSVTVDYLFGTSVDDLALLSALKAFPNPGQDQVWVEFDMQRSQALSLRMIDYTGKTVIRQQLDARSGEQRISLDTDQLASGVYFIMLEGDGVRGYLKWVKQ